MHTKKKIYVHVSELSKIWSIWLLSQTSLAVPDLQNFAVHVLQYIANRNVMRNDKYSSTKLMWTVICYYVLKQIPAIFNFHGANIWYISCIFFKLLLFFKSNFCLNLARTLTSGLFILSKIREDFLSYARDIWKSLSVCLGN